MNLLAWKGELLVPLNNSMFVTDGASAGEHVQPWLIDRPCQNKKAEPHYLYRNRICGNSATTTSLFVPTAKIRQICIFDLWLLCHCFDVRLHKRVMVSGRDIWLISGHKQCSSSHPLIMGAWLQMPVWLQGLLSQHLIMPVIKDRAAITLEEPWLTCQGGTRLLCDLVVRRRALCMSEPRIKTDGTWGNYSAECWCLLGAANSEQIFIFCTATRSE